MTFEKLSTYIQRIEETSSRLKITEILAELFKELTPAEYEKTIYLLLGRLTPIYKTLNFGMAEKLVIRAVASSIQMDVKDFTNEYKRVGDIGEVAHKLKKEHASLHQVTLDVLDVYDRLVDLAKEAGSGSQDMKLSQLSALIQDLDPLSARYVVRIPLGVLRLGFSAMTVLDALSWMHVGDKSLRPMLQKAYHVHPDIGIIGRKLMEKGVKEVEKIQPALFTPILMMRAERLSSGAEIIDQIGECAIEPKFDGFRLQVHKKGNEVRLYTRGLEDATFMYPDIVNGVQKEVTAKEVILEGEAIGYDIAGENFLPFQETVQRKRKYDIAQKAAEIPLKLFAFELLLLNGTNYVHEPFIKRRKELESIIKNSGDTAKDTVIVADEHIESDPKKIELLFDDAIAKGLEGIIAKKQDGTYQPGARGWNWIKFKRSYSSHIDDTIDCMVMGYDLGKGKRTAFGIGAFLVGIYDTKQERYVTLAKVGTGLTDDEWRELKKRSDKLTSKKPHKQYEIDKLMECDVWVDPGIVVEIKADEISRSTIHTAGRTMKASKSGNALTVDVAGYALRFPRLERFRDDKSVQEVTTLKEVAQMFAKQKTSHS
ncbi:MAG: ATP-dependent DNA ligase [bacterium]|nr:ATP-dependent DNA ligase [bacterium]